MKVRCEDLLRRGPVRGCAAERVEVKVSITRKSSNPLA